MKTNPILLAAMVGLGFAASASAAALAFATNQLTDFTISVSTTNYTVGAGNRNTTTLANYSGFFGATDTDPVPSGNASDALQATSGPGPFPAEPTWTQDVGMVGSRGDAYTSGQSPFAVGGVQQVFSMAESNGSGGPDGNAIGQNTNAISSITLNEDATITFSFNAYVAYWAQAGLGETATTRLENSFEITGAAGTVFAYKPSDVNLEATASNGLLAYTNGQGQAFSGTSPLLPAGTYAISLKGASSAEIFTVPEPSVALLGVLGLLGLVRRRRA